MAFENVNVNALKGSRKMVPPMVKGFSSFSQEWRELLFQTKILAVGTSLGHLSIKNALLEPPSWP